MLPRQASSILRDTTRERTGRSLRPCLVRLVVRRELHVHARVGRGTAAAELMNLVIDHAGYGQAVGADDEMNGRAGGVNQATVAG